MSKNQELKTKIEKAIAEFNYLGLEAEIADGTDDTLMLIVKDGIEVELSDSEINYRAEFFDKRNLNGLRDETINVPKIQDVFSKNFVLKLNSLKITNLFKEWGIKDERCDDDDFDGGNFFQFDKELFKRGYVRLGVDLQQNRDIMIVVEKNYLNNLIKSNYSYDVMYECEKLYLDEDCEEHKELIEAFYEAYQPILKALNLSKEACIYVDGLEYVIDEFEKLGYKHINKTAEDNDLLLDNDFDNLSLDKKDYEFENLFLEEDDGLEDIEEEICNEKPKDTSLQFNIFNDNKLDEDFYDFVKKYKKINVQNSTSKIDIKLLKLYLDMTLPRVLNKHKTEIKVFMEMFQTKDEWLKKENVDDYDKNTLTVHEIIKLRKRAFDADYMKELIVENVENYICNDKSLDEIEKELEGFKKSLLDKGLKLNWLKG